MSKMAELAYDIEQLYIEGFSPRSIATQLECPLEIVYDWLEEFNLAKDVADEDGCGPDLYDPHATINS